MQNIEIKTRIEDPAEAERRILELGAAPVWVRRQRDTFFNVPRGYLKLRVCDAEGSEAAAEPAELIAYAREPGTKPRASDYHIVRITAPDELEPVLTRSLGRRGVVRKTRRLFRWNHTRIHLDEVAGLGWFLELETVIEGITRREAETEARDAIASLGLDPSAFLDRPYLELLETKGSPPE
jgi:adenylate cyclase class IV